MSRVDIYVHDYVGGLSERHQKKINLTKKLMLLASRRSSGKRATNEQIEELLRLSKSDDLTGLQWAFKPSSMELTYEQAEQMIEQFREWK